MEIIITPLDYKHGHFDKRITGNITGIQCVNPFNDDIRIVISGDKYCSHERIKSNESYSIDIPNLSSIYLSISLLGFSEMDKKIIVKVKDES